MPLIMVRYNPVGLGFVDSEGLWCSNWQGVFCGFTAELPAIVARHLHVEDPEEGNLTAADVEVEANPRQVGDVSNYVMGITVFANLYGLRLVDLDERRKKIQGEIKIWASKYFPNCSGKVAVWVPLFNASFGEFDLLPKSLA